MTELTFDELVKNFNIISKALAVDEFDCPVLNIEMRMGSKEEWHNFCADFKYVEVKDRYFLIGVYGNGSTPEEAMRNYYNKIKGKHLVYRAANDGYRREYVVV
jgi:hypothetical protein